MDSPEIDMAAKLMNIVVRSGVAQTNFIAVDRGRVAALIAKTSVGETLIHPDPAPHS
jgi:hypothetical protein